MILVEEPQRVGTGPRREGPIARAAHPELDEIRELGFVLNDQDRLSHVDLGRGEGSRSPSCLGGDPAAVSQQRQREGNARSGAAIWSVLEPKSPAVRLDQPPADIESQPRAWDPRFANVPGAVERFRDERPFRGRDAHPLIIDRDRQPLPVDPRRDGDEPIRRTVFESVFDEVLEYLADPSGVDLDRWEVGDDSTTNRSDRPDISRSPRSRVTSAANRTGARSRINGSAWRWVTSRI